MRIAAITIAIVVLISAISAASPAEAVKLTVNGREAASLAGGPAVERHADGTVFFRAAALAALTGAQVDASGQNIAWFEKFLHTRPGTTRYSCGPTDVRDAGAAPMRTDSGYWLPAKMLEGAFGWKIEATDDGVSLWTPGAGVTGVRRGVHPDRIRIVIDLSGPSAFQVLRAADQVTLALPPPEKPTGTAGEIRVLEFSGDNVQHVAQKIESDGWTTLTLPFTGVKDVEVFSVADPARIVADFVLLHPSTEPTTTEQPGQPSTTEPSTTEPTQPSTTQPSQPTTPTKPPTPAELPKPHLSEGEWKTMAWPAGGGSCTVHLFLFNPTGNGFELRPAMCGDVVQQFGSVKRIASAHHAIAAVNGGFFSPGDRVPLGAVVIDHEWIRIPLDERPVFGIMDDGQCDISRIEFEGRVHFAKLGFLPLSGINQSHWADDTIVVYTRRWGAHVPEQLRTTRLLVSSKGRVLKRVVTGEEVQVPQGGMVISGYGRRALSLKKVPIGCEVRLSFKTIPAWAHLKHALGGGPLLLHDGHMVLDPGREHFHDDIASGRHARTALGIMTNGRVLLVAVEGGKGGRGPGLTLTELAKMMMHLGCKSAMNLDGGGSTTFVVHDSVVSCCSDGSPRSVANALIVVRRNHSGD